MLSPNADVSISATLAEADASSFVGGAAESAEAAQMPMSRAGETRKEVIAPSYAGNPAHGSGGGYGGVVFAGGALRRAAADSESGDLMIAIRAGTASAAAGPI